MTETYVVHVGSYDEREVTYAGTDGDAAWAAAVDRHHVEVEVWVTGEVVRLIWREREYDDYSDMHSPPRCVWKWSSFDDEAGE